MEPAALAIRGVELEFRRGFLLRPRPVLRGIELELAPGEALGLVGPNGSGKSTLLALAAGLLAPGRGSLAVFGQSATGRAARAQVGHVADGFPFPPELGARAVLELFGALAGLARAERRRRADEWLARVGLAGEARTPLGAFSLGMRRRFALAQALAHRPALLLFDEPGAGLDAEGHVVLAELLGEARARGATLLLASHVPAELAEHCPRTRVLCNGRLVEECASADLVRTPARLRELYRRHAGPS